MKKLISRNPFDHSIVGEIAVSTTSEIIEKVKQAHATQQHWKSLGAKKRIEILQPLWQAFQQKENDIVQTTTQEIGKPITQARENFKSDMVYFQAFLNDGAKYIEDEITVRDGKTLHRIIYEPRGVVASIAPWNYPFSNFIWAVIPNLIVGNTVIFKHSEECPLLGKIVEEVMLSLPELPLGVFAEIYGGSDIGEYLVQQNIDMIWFTGSSNTGKKIFNIAGKKQIKAILEMGGSNPAIIFEDADLNVIGENIFSGRFHNAGQSCDAIKRVIVHQSLYTKLIDQLATQAAKMKMGNPELESTELGPLVAMRQLALLEEQVNDSIRAGAKVIIGGHRLPNSAGAFYVPTILTNIQQNMRVWCEEVFGPVLPIVSFETEKEAVTLANDTIYGLGATIYSQDLNRAHRIAAQLDASCVDINQGNHWLPCNPFGGFKSSGMGCEHGRLGFQDLCRFKIIAES